MNVTRRWLKSLFSPIDRLILVSRTFRTAARPWVGEKQPPAEMTSRGLIARLPAHDQKGWPEIRLPLPQDAEFRSFEEVFFRRVATWLTSDPADVLHGRYRDALAELGIVRAERGSGEIRRIIAEVDGTKLVVSIVDPGSGLNLIGITQHAR